MRKHLYVGALTLIILASVAVLPAVVVRVAEDIRTLVTLEFHAVTYEPR